MTELSPQESNYKFSGKETACKVRALHKHELSSNKMARITSDCDDPTRWP